MEVHEHPTTSPILQKAIQSNLPYSVNLAYRTTHAYQTEHAHILATFSPSATSVPKCWAAAYLDRAMRPETELWLYAAGQDPAHLKSDSGIATEKGNGNGSDHSETLCQDCSTAVLSLIDAMSHLPTPPMFPDALPALDVARAHEKEFPTPGPDGQYPSSHPGSYLRHLLLPQVVTLGACHSALFDLCVGAGLLRPELPGPGSRLNDFLFRHADLPEPRELPEGLVWGTMREKDLAVVQARTPIPRSPRTLLTLKNVGVFEGERPVAWAFEGVDGSLTSLHTEEDFRGKGLAKAVAIKLFKESVSGEGDEGDRWSHAKVYMGNVQSESVCRSLGGKALWQCFWLRIDLGLAGSLAKQA